MIFSSLDLAPNLQKGIDACGYRQMTPIQEQAIIPARRGKDILAIAQTGTGKTAAFAIPLLQQLLDKPRKANQTAPRALMLTPTRELAEQLAETIGQYAQFVPLSITAVYGGVKMGGQENKLTAGVDILIATPGRLLEHLAQCTVDLAAVEFVVLDESDRMLDMGFVTDVQALLQLTAKKRQTLFFSATLSPAVNELAHKLLNKQYQTIRVSKNNITAETVEHVLYAVEERRKIDLFLELLAEHNWYKVLVFTSTKDQANKLKAKLKKHPVAICHGDISQGARRRALADFKSAKVQILIATEVAARGLDIEALDYVVNYNLPFLAEDYVHRIGRTGRAGNKGHAISFVSREEERNLDAIQALIGQKIKRLKRSGFEVMKRDALLNKIAENKPLVRSNKASQTQINQDSTAKPDYRRRKTKAKSASGKKSKQQGKQW